MTGADGVASIFSLIFFANRAQSIVPLFFTEHYILLYFFQSNPYIGPKQNNKSPKLAPNTPATPRPTTI